MPYTFVSGRQQLPTLAMLATGRLRPRGVQARASGSLRYAERSRLCCRSALGEHSRAASQRCGTCGSGDEEARLTALGMRVSGLLSAHHPARALFTTGLVPTCLARSLHPRPLRLSLFFETHDDEWGRGQWWSRGDARCGTRRRVGRRRRGQCRPRGADTGLRDACHSRRLPTRPW